jgi:two-component system, NarL family, response regulator NreC
MTKNLRLLLVDDHEIVRAGLRMLFQAEPDMEIVAEAGSGAEAVVAAGRLKPDVIIMDVAMPGMNGIEATRRIKSEYPDACVLALTMHEDEQYFVEILNAGAAGYIPKRAAPDDLVSAIRAVAEGHVFLHASLARFLVREAAKQDDSDTSVLTPRELEVLTLIADGKTSREIAEELVISAKTVDRHRENIMSKLDIHNRVDLVKYAISKGLIDAS